MAEVVVVDDDNSQWEPVVITVDDDDIITTGTKCSGGQQDSDTTILDEDIQVISDDVSIVSANPFIDKTLTGNRQLTEIIQCLVKLDSTPTMYTAINTNLAYCYKNAGYEYKWSGEFKKVMRKVKKDLEEDPASKYFHIKVLCRALQLGFTRKRAIKSSNKVQNVISKARRKRRKLSRKTSPINTIDLIDLEDDEFSSNESGLVIDLADESDSEPIQVPIQVYAGTNDLEKYAGRLNGADKFNRVIKKGAEKTNEIIINGALTNKEVITNNSELLEYDETQNKLTNKEVITNNSELLEYDETQNKSSTIENNHETVSFDEGLLAPQRTELNLEEQIENLENIIAKHHKLIEKLEQEEVSTDNFLSPYLKSEYHKQEVVSCYEKLCALTGSASTKRHKITLKVKEGHPPGPVKVLQDFLNNNVGSNGILSFPDFVDVVECVREANGRYSLGWNEKQIKNEAEALFVQCGKALQKRRRLREWKDVLRSVKREDVDHDPANDDPELQAKLEANRRLGQKNENDLLDRYSTMQATSKFPQKEKIPLHNNNNELVDKFDEKSRLYTTPNSSENSTLPSKSIENCRNTLLPNFAKKPIIKITPIPVSISDFPKENIFKEENLNSVSKLESSSSEEVRSDLSHSNAIDQGPGIGLNNILYSNQNSVNVSSRKVIASLTETNTSHLGSQVQSNNTLSSNQVTANLSRKYDVINVTKSLSKIAPMTTSSETLNSHQVLVEDYFKKESISKTPESNTLKPLIKSNLSKVFEDVFIQRTELEHTSHALDNICDIGDDKNNSPKEISHELIAPENIKLEPTDIIIKQLEALGENYTTHIIDIEDPFLVIEISSDSSDDEGDDR